MVYGYIRVSTDKQTVENQRWEIQKYSERENLGNVVWIEETTSGAKLPCRRKLGSLLNRCRRGDVLIATELSRLGRSLFMVIDILNRCLKRGIIVITIKDNYRLGDDVTSKVLAFAFGLSAELERKLISQRVREAMQKRKAEGAILGRPWTLRNYADEIRRDWGTVTIEAMASKYGVSPSTVWRFAHRFLGIPSRQRFVFARRRKNVPRGTLSRR